MRKALWLAALVFLVGRGHGACPAISEIAASPSQGEPEWIELADRSGIGVVLAGWTIGDLRVRGGLDSSAVVPAGGRLVVSSDCGRLASWYGTSSIPCAEPAAWNALSVESDLILLRDGEGRTCDSVSWNAEWPTWPQGRSLERRDIASDGSHPGAWIASPGPRGGTPGWVTESVLEPAGAAIGIEMKVRKVVPGRSEILARIVSPWNLRLKAEVFDLSRRRVAVLHDGPVPVDGLLSWDGTDRGRTVLPGAHMLLLELGEGGRDVQARFREWIVVAR